MSYNAANTYTAFYFHYVVQTSPRSVRNFIALSFFLFFVNSFPSRNSLCICLPFYRLLLLSIRASARNVIADVGLLMRKTPRARPSKVIFPSITWSRKSSRAARYAATYAKSKINFVEADEFVRGGRISPGKIREWIRLKIEPWINHTGNKAVAIFFPFFGGVCISRCTSIMFGSITHASVSHVRYANWHKSGWW